MSSETLKKLRIEYATETRAEAIDKLEQCGRNPERLIRIFNQRFDSTDVDLDFSITQDELIRALKHIQNS